MSPLWRYGLWLWAGLLAGILCLAFLPFSPLVGWLMLLPVALICLVGIGRARRQPNRAFSESLFSLPSENPLPPENHRLPVVLVCGDGLASLFGTERMLQTAQGCWLRVDEINSLQLFTRQLLWQRPEWAAQLAVMVVVNPQQRSDERQLAADLQELRWQLMQLRSDSRHHIPLLVSSTVATSVASDVVWLSQQQTPPLTLWSTVSTPGSLADWQRAQSSVVQAERLKQTVLFSSHHDWLKTQVFSLLQVRNEDVVPVAVQQIIQQQVAGLPDIEQSSLWQHWLTAHTSLTQVSGWHPQPAAAHDALPLPDFVFSALPLGSGVSSRRRVLRHGVTLLTLAVMVALCSSAWQNRQLLQRVTFDIRHYYSVAMTDHAPKAQAVAVLRADAAELDNGFRNGEPLRLGLGLYQGWRLRLPLLAAVKTYVPPPAAIGKETPTTVRLDSLSLFDVGKFQLKPGSIKMLVDALMNIRAKPGWLIVVAGHTDITGDAQANQILSLKRAEALRDWMLSTSDVSPTCFAVQGYGATRPVATNDTAEGRAANRRVEISLVPQADACQVPETVNRSQEHAASLNK
ncbi:MULTISPECIES: OmpA family protein [Yersinia]|uniref:OmpA family protein n=1 Tax=Yersinia TaxID=629 RepID=UPI0005DF3458|nr:MULTISPECIES: OmpA family protein [Yersinia]EKN4720561.1 OmpA family protein [Yersinia enterocolitica]EKN4732671.1 OmpA family protein [Yersinia enterocolitica]ELI7912871.1 OmpA family protein [Yersinia enterocolitica]ELI7926387.1 OmpA family protein [Yersinia enterocolitica]ELI7959683.1 OmpA family protein [Yersinia enterocolitica]